MHRRSTAPLLRSWVRPTHLIGSGCPGAFTSLLRVPATTTVDKVGAAAAPRVSSQALSARAGREGSFRPARKSLPLPPGHAARRPRH